MSKLSLPTDRKGLMLNELSVWPDSFNETKERLLGPIDGEQLIFGISNKSQIVGGLVLLPDGYGAAEIGFWLSEGQTGKGYATLAIRAMAKRGDYDTLYAKVPVENSKAADVLRRANFSELARSAGRILFCHGRTIESGRPLYR